MTSVLWPWKIDAPSTPKLTNFLVTSFHFLRLPQFPMRASMITNITASAPTPSTNFFKERKMGTRYQSMYNIYMNWDPRCIINCSDLISWGSYVTNKEHSLPSLQLHHTIHALNHFPNPKQKWHSNEYQASLVLTKTGTLGSIHSTLLRGWPNINNVKMVVNWTSLCFPSWVIALTTWVRTVSTKQAKNYFSFFSCPMLLEK